MSRRSVGVLSAASMRQPCVTVFFFSIDSCFSVTEYLRSWSLVAQLRAHLCECVGYTWFSKREAGSLLRELWSEGQRINADELLKDVTGAELEMGAVAERISEDLR